MDPVDRRRRPGEGRYARVEREQRWALRHRPDGLIEPTSIVDRYLIGTRLRLRRADARSDVVYKLGQKVRPNEASPELVKLTNIYLSESEYEVFRRLPAYELRKTRWRLRAGSRQIIIVDEFHDHLAGLVLAEVELAPGEAFGSLPGVPAVDVTLDDRFSGGRLAAASAAEVRELLDGVAAAIGR
jgi:CYTH domain-containing protein